VLFGIFNPSSVPLNSVTEALVPTARSADVFTVAPVSTHFTSISKEATPLAAPNVYLPIIFACVLLLLAGTLTTVVNSLYAWATSVAPAKDIPLLVMTASPEDAVMNESTPSTPEVFAGGFEGFF